MAERSINEILDTWQSVAEISGPQVAAECELIAMANALREARDVLERSAAECYTRGCGDRADELLKKWDAHE